MQQVELSQETPSKPTAHGAALSKQNLKGPSVLAQPIPALEGRSDPLPGLQGGGPSAVSQQDWCTAPVLTVVTAPTPVQPGAPAGAAATHPPALLKAAGPGGLKGTPERAQACVGP